MEANNINNILYIKHSRHNKYYTHKQKPKSKQSYNRFWFLGIKREITDVWMWMFRFCGVCACVCYFLISWTEKNFKQKQLCRFTRYVTSNPNLSNLINVLSTSPTQVSLSSLFLRSNCRKLLLLLLLCTMCIFNTLRFQGWVNTQAILYMFI